MPTLASTPFPQLQRESLQRVLLACGTVASLLYVTVDLAASGIWREYSYSAQAISELSAIDAPTRPLWLLFGVVYQSLLFAFAWGAWLAAGQRRTLRVTAGLLFGMVAVGIAWMFFPMHLRGAPTTLTDAAHAVFAGVQVVLTLCAIGFAAVGFGRGFRIYSIASLAIMLAFGVATFLYAPRVAAGLPTPGFGLLERVNVYGYLLWIAMLGAALSRRGRARGMP